MIGQKLEVAVLVDTDNAGEMAWSKLVKGWLTKYQSTPSLVFRLGECTEVPGEFSIEDVFETDYYTGKVLDACKNQLTSAGVSRLTLDGGGQLVKQVERACEALGFHYNKGSVAKLIRTDLANMKTAEDLSARTRDYAVAIFAKIRQAFKEDEVTLPTVPRKADKARKRKPS